MLAVPETVVAREARADVTIDDFLNGAFTQLVEDTSDEDGADEEDSDASDVELVRSPRARAARVSFG